MPNIGTSTLYNSITGSGKLTEYFRNYNYDRGSNRATQDNVTQVTKDIQTCHTETTTEIVNGKPKTKKVKVCVPDKKITQNTKSSYYTTNGLNQYTSLKTGSGTANEMIIPFIYDLNGNLIQDDTQRYTYDYKNRLVTVKTYNTDPTKDNILKESYTYDTLGRRLTKKINNQLTKYVYANQDAIEETLYTQNVTNGNLTKKESRAYLYGNDVDDVLTMRLTKYQKVGKVYQVLSDDTYTYHKDHLGSVIAITDRDGKVVEQYQYDEFGKAYIYDWTATTSTGVTDTGSTNSGTTNSGTTDTGSVNTGSTDTGAIDFTTTITTKRKVFTVSDIGNTRLYTGREYSQKTGLYYLRARYYDANLGRFISQDPIGVADDINLYSYTANNPVNSVDRMGTDKKMIGNADTVRILFSNSLVGHISIQVGFDIYIFGLPGESNTEVYGKGIASLFAPWGLKGSVSKTRIDDLLIDPDKQISYYDFNANKSEFLNLKKYLEDSLISQDHRYTVSGENCATFAYNALYSAGIVDSKMSYSDIIPTLFNLNLNFDKELKSKVVESGVYTTPSTGSKEQLHLMDSIEKTPTPVHIDMSWEKQHLLNQ